MDTKQSVWMVEEGEYSDYHICGIFSTEEKAKLHIDELRKESIHNDPNCVEVTLDELSDKYCQDIWHVYIKVNDGSLHDTWRGKNVVEKGYSHSFSNDMYSCGCSAISEDHAMKVAVEARQAYLRKDI